MLPKIDYVRSVCSVYVPDIVCIVESWLDDSILDAEICIQGYSLFRLDRTRHGGGVLIFVKSLFIVSVIFEGTPEFECLALSVRCNDNSPGFLIVLFYRPPNSGHSPLDNLFDFLCNVIVTHSSNLYLIGDFNVNFLEPTTPLYHKLLSIVSSFNLTQVVSEPTRVTNLSSTLIDLIFNPRRMRERGLQ